MITLEIYRIMERYVCHNEPLSETSKRTYVLTVNRSINAVKEGT